MQITIDYTWKVVIDIIIAVVLIIPSIVFKATGKPFHRGFFCDDESIRRPFKSDTISTPVLFIVGGGLPFFGIIINEVFLRNITKIRRSATTVSKYALCLGKSTPIILLTLYVYIAPFVFGCVICQCSTDIGKYMIGRLRPHFIDVCQPDWSKIKCTENNLPVYITDIECLGKDTKHIKESRLSHPSGHSSFSVYTMLFFAFYMQKRLKIGWNRSIKFGLQFIVMMLAVACCLSRISDYKHHWSDVLGGAILGTIVCLYTVFSVSILYKKNIEEVEKNELAANERAEREQSCNLGSCSEP
ncbi:DgyrCDS10341 [Dimorphilus gyrociliatus]|uniref:DgyrCDS10341 n=1 Tax=Dimorphilus gyrociliatus TaxID=2664684 RepID=A0A7I8VZW1_9ANNE|nr:DgyrCDS10341 [Dimorphilus gyrociliatus]